MQTTMTLQYNGFVYWIPGTTISNKFLLSLLLYFVAIQTVYMNWILLSWWWKSFTLLTYFRCPSSFVHGSLLGRSKILFGMQESMLKRFGLLH